MPFQFRDDLSGDNSRKLEIGEHGEKYKFIDHLKTWTNVTGITSSATVISNRDGKTYKAYMVTQGTPSVTATYNFKFIQKGNNIRRPFSSLTHSIWVGSATPGIDAHPIINTTQDRAFYHTLGGSDNLYILVGSPGARAEGGVADNLAYQYKIDGGCYMFRFEDYDDDYNDSYLIISSVTETLVGALAYDTTALGTVGNLTSLAISSGTNALTGALSALAPMTGGTAGGIQLVQAAGWSAMSDVSVLSGLNVGNIVFGIAYRTVVNTTTITNLFDFGGMITIMGTSTGKNEKMTIGSGTKKVIRIPDHAFGDDIFISLAYNRSMGNLFYRIDINNEQGMTTKIMTDSPDPVFTSAISMIAGGGGNSGDTVQFAALAYRFPTGNYSYAFVDSMMKHIKESTVGYTHN